MEQQEQLQASEQQAEQVTNDPLETKEVQMAAGRYAQFCKRIRGISKGMSAKGLYRVLVASSEFPFAEGYPKFRSKTEEELFNLVLANNSAKSVVSAALASSREEIEQRVVDSMKEEFIAEKQKEETNG